MSVGQKREAALAQRGPISAAWRRALLAAAMVLMMVPLANGQSRPPIPDQPETARLVWSTLIAVDHANKTGDYSVLRELGAPAFRERNDAAALAGVFSGIRDIGLGRVILYPPQFTAPPAILDNGMYRVQGVFPLRPEGILFDLVFQYVDGEWQVFGIGIAPEEPRVIESDNSSPKPKPDVSTE